jgi:hypothetical protein
MEFRFASEEEKKHKGAFRKKDDGKQIRAVQPAAWRIYLAQRGSFRFLQE